MKHLSTLLLLLMVLPAAAQQAAPEPAPLPADLAREMDAAKEAAAAQEQPEAPAEMPAEIAIPPQAQDADAEEVPGTEAAEETAEEVEEKEPVVFREPSNAMFHRRYLPVEIKLQPGWKLTPAQMVTAMQLPIPRKNGRGYLYPEDLDPTPEQKADGSALSANQRAQMRRARKNAADSICWEAYKAAKAYNREHEEELLAQMRKGKHIRVNLATQHGYYMDGETMLRDFGVCSGKKSTPTPTGLYSIIEKDKDHKSNLYNSAKMPFYLRLTLDGVGLHQGPLMGYPASHGCIRLGMDTAKYLYTNCEVGLPVYLYKDAKEPIPKKPAPAKKAPARRKRR